MNALDELLLEIPDGADEMDIADRLLDLRVGALSEVKLMRASLSEYSEHMKEYDEATKRLRSRAETAEAALEEAKRVIKTQQRLLSTKGMINIGIEEWLQKYGDK